MQVDNSWYWNQHPQHHVITVTTGTILHKKLEFNTVTDFHTIPKSVCIRKQAKKAISRQPICLTDSDYDYILEEIGCRETIEFERDVEVYGGDEKNSYEHFKLLFYVFIIYSYNNCNHIFCLFTCSTSI